jgi:hypothetical protein
VEINLAERVRLGRDPPLAPPYNVVRHDSFGRGEWRA